MPSNYCAAGQLLSSELVGLYIHKPAVTNWYTATNVPQNLFLYTASSHSLTVTTDQRAASHQKRSF